MDAEWYGPERSADSDPITCIDGVDMAKICEYANSKGVGMWVYLNDIALKKYDLDRTFSTYQKWGVVGIKHGFLNGGSQAKNEFSHEVVRKCAEYHIMYNLHEPNKPTGVRRTLPNYMTREYTNGMLDGPGRPASTPTQLCTFPVVHNLAGPVDRSCGMFDLDASITREKVHRHLPTTVASQTAQCLIFPTGVLTIPDHPDAYKRKSDLFEFIRMLPMTWDETRVPEMEIGNFVTIARRSGQQWFVGSLANEAGRKLESEARFLRTRHHLRCDSLRGRCRRRLPNDRECVPKRSSEKRAGFCAEQDKTRTLSGSKADRAERRHGQCRDRPRRRPHDVDPPTSPGKGIATKWRQHVAVGVSPKDD